MQVLYFQYLQYILFLLNLTDMWYLEREIEPKQYCHLHFIIGNGM